MEPVKCVFSTIKLSLIDFGHSSNTGQGNGVKCHFQQYFSYIMAVSFIDGGNQSTRRKPPSHNAVIPSHMHCKRVCLLSNEKVLKID